MKSVKIGIFKITHITDGSIHKVTMSPGAMVIIGTNGQTIRNKSDSYHESDTGYASYRWDQFIKYARNENAARLWERLNKKPLEVYIRYQKLVARHTNGKWVRGLTIHNGHARLNYE